MRVYHDFFCYPDPDPRFLKWFRIRIRLNDKDPTGPGSETLISWLLVHSENTKDTENRLPLEVYP